MPKKQRRVTKAPAAPIVSASPEASAADVWRAWRGELVQALSQEIASFEDQRDVAMRQLGATEGAAQAAKFWLERIKAGPA